MVGKLSNSNSTRREIAISIRKAVRKSECNACGAGRGLLCLNKQTGERIKGIHRERRWMAFAEGLVAQKEGNPYGLEPK